MTDSKFYRFSLLLPLAVPAVFAPLLLVDFHLPRWLVWAALYTTFSGIIGGLPYLALVGPLFLWPRRKSDRQFKLALILLPILMLPVVAVLFGLGLLGEALLKPESALPVADALVMLLGLVPFILGFGYFYVLLVLGAARILKRLGLLIPSRAT